MLQGILLIIIGAVLWLVTILLFRVLGPYVILDLNSSVFISFLLLLLAVALLIVAGISLLIRLRIFPRKGSAVRFGYWTALIGLVINGFVFWHRDLVFPGYSEAQHQSFAVCIMFANALVLLVPALIDPLIRVKPPIVTKKVEPAPDTPSVTSISKDKGSI
jgi:hypothetical protein